MSKDPFIESHIADSKAKIEKLAPETVEAERHIDRTQRALERSRMLLEGMRDPLQLARRVGGFASRAIAHRGGAGPEKRSALKAKVKRRPG